jgi:hypothetical protein
MSDCTGSLDGTGIERDISWLLAELQNRHREPGRAMTAAMVEALTAGHQLGAGIVVSKRDFGSNLRAAARVDDLPFHAL